MKEQKIRLYWARERGQWTVEIDGVQHYANNVHLDAKGKTKADATADHPKAWLEFRGRVEFFADDAIIFPAVQLASAACQLVPTF